MVSSCGGAVDASASAGGPFEVAPEVASLRVSMASLRGLPEKVEELSLQVQLSVRKAHSCRPIARNHGMAAAHPLMPSSTTHFVC